MAYLAIDLRLTEITKEGFVNYLDKVTIRNLGEL